MIGYKKVHKFEEGDSKEAPSNNLSIIWGYNNYQRITLLLRVKKEDEKALQRFSK